MTITYHGEGCFRIQSGNFSLIVDASSERFKADVAIKTLATPSENKEGGENPREITTAGEYEISEARISGFQIQEDPPAGGSRKEIKSVYIATIEDMRLGFLGHISSVPSPETLEQFADIDILFVPLRDTNIRMHANDTNIGLSAEDAAKIVKQIEPHIVIPSLIKNPKEFLKELGKSAEATEKLTIKKKDVAEGLSAVWLRE